MKVRTDLCERTVSISRGDWQTRIETASKMFSNGGSFIVTNALEPFEGNVQVFSKAWTTMTLAIVRE